MAAQAPTASAFMRARGLRLAEMDHEKYMDLAESYADFVVEFEKTGGDVSMCERWPLSRAGRFVDY